MTAEEELRRPSSILRRVRNRRVAPLPSAPTKVRLLNRLPTLDLGGGD